MKKLLFFGLLVLPTQIFAQTQNTQVDTTIPSGNQNVAIGATALSHNTANGNTAVGVWALSNHSQGTPNGSNSGVSNSAFGILALSDNLTGNYNSAFGHGSLNTNTSGSYNVGLGSEALSIMTSGSNNVGIGYRTLYRNNASNNIAIGSESLAQAGGAPVATNTGNIGIGWQSGLYHIGDNNIFIGNRAGASFSGSGNVIIGRPPTGSTINNTIIFATNTSGATNGTERMRIDSNGKFGIGTPTPQNKMDVEGSVAIGANYSGTNTAPTNSLIVEGAIGVGLVNPGNKVQITTGTTGSSGLRFTNLTDSVVPTQTATKFLTVTNLGDVVLRNLPGSSSGSTTVAAGTNVSVSGSPSSGYTVSATPSLSISGQNLSISGGNTISLPTTTDTSIYLGDGNISSNRKVNLSAKLLFNTTGGGTVYIGDQTSAASASTVSGYKLFVEDGIMAEKVKVALAGSSSWPDYVFAPDYALPTLGEVKSYIDREGHLPDVPSAAEIKKEGINLGDMQTIQMKKIEELTLYIVEQDEQIKVQQKKFEEQSRILETLQKQVDLLLQKNSVKP